MKRKTKFGIALASLGIGVLALSGCTASFCSTTDKAHMLAAYDNGVCRFYDAGDAEKPTENCYELKVNGVSNVWFTYSYANISQHTGVSPYVPPPTDAQHSCN